MRIDLSSEAEIVEAKANRDVKKLIDYVFKQNLDAKEEKYIFLGLSEWLKDVADSCNSYWW